MIEDKLLLSHLRDGDFTHPGSLEAINLVMKKFSKDPTRKILDVGCGLGGTASFVQKNNWGMVTGIDIDGQVIYYAKQAYPKVNFHQCGVDNVAGKFPPHQFDLIYIFSAFFSFKAQQESLKALASITKDGGKLALFDYSSMSDYQSTHPFPSNNNKPFAPLNIKAMPNMLSLAGWQLDQVVDLTDHFLRWYQTILDHLARNKTQLIHQFSQTTFDKVHSRFQTLAQLLKDKILGGTIVYATKI